MLNLIVLIMAVFYFGAVFGRKATRKNSEAVGFLKGRLDMREEMETRILARARRNPNYDEEKVRKDLLE